MFYGMAETLTAEQHDYIYKIFNKDITFCDAIPGSGKTTVAVACADYLIKTNKNLKGLIYIFSPTEEESMGFRPGTQGEKEMAYCGPLQDALIKIGYQPEHINKDGGWVQARSHTFLRGINLEEYVVIIDEAQNYTKRELKKTLTRLHVSGRGIVIGHTGQCDLKRPSQSGFAPFLKHFAKDSRTGIARLTHDFRGWISQHADAIDSDVKEAWLKKLYNNTRYMFKKWLRGYSN
jgi:phosphate starvation-inducible protein PhoH